MICERRVAALAKSVKLLIIALVVVAGIAAMPHPAAASEPPAGFIRSLGDQALTVIRSAATPAQKEAYLHRMLKQDFALTDISRFVLGPYWRVASAAQRQGFRRLLERRIMHFYGERLAQYHNEGFRVTGSRTSPAGITVTSQILRPQGPPITVDWQLTLSDGVYKIDDVAIDGVSMALALRTEFTGAIERNGGQLGSLLAMMREES
jgi:phospholipid transport system substrate-binding protein